MITYSWHAYCTVCKDCVASGPPSGIGTQEGLEGWLQHLLQEGHQSLARENLLQNWGEGERASTLLVLGTSRGVGEDDKLIKFLSTKVAEAVVVDFVWWPNTPKTGFVQFESEEKVKLVFETLGGRYFRIDEDGQCYQAMAGWLIQDDLWKNLFEGCWPRISRPISTAPEEFDASDSEPQSELGDVTSASSSPLNSLPLGATAETCNIESSKVSELDLDSHLQAIRKVMQISDEDYSLAQAINDRLQNLAYVERGRGSFQNLISIGLGHHWLLKLKYSPKGLGHNQALTISLFCRPVKADPGVTKDKRKVIPKIDKQLFSMEEGMNDFLSFEVLPGFPKFANVANNAWEELRYKIKNPGNELPFLLTINNSTFYAVEAQMWRLLRYLCQFDPHCYPVLMVLLYWAQANSVTLGSSGLELESWDGIPRSKENQGPQIMLRNVPAPAGLAYLLMLYFQLEGMIPSPKSFMKAPHQPIPYNRRDIGFAESDEAVLAWKTSKKVDGGKPTKEQFAQEVFTLLYKFFLFSADKLGDGGAWILDTMNGEIHSYEEVVMDREKMSNANNSDNLRPPVRRIWMDVGDSAAERIVMMDPLMGHWRISTHNAFEALDAMEETGVKLRDYFEPKKGIPEKLELGQFLKMLTVEKQEL